MKILIFGATGNCGRACFAHLANHGHEVYGVARSAPTSALMAERFFQGDICSGELFARLPDDFDAVINFAGVQPSILPVSEATNRSETYRQYVDVNIRGVFNILEYCRQAKISRYIYTTTHRDYENYWSSDTELAHDLPPAINYQGDHAMYAISKTSAKMIGDYFGTVHAMRVFNLRLPMIFLVPEEPYYLHDGKPVIMPFLKIIRDAMNGETLEIWGDPSMRRDYVHIDNLISLIDACLESPQASCTLNVGTGEGVTTDRFVRAISEVFSPPGAGAEFIYRPEKTTYKSAVYDISFEQQHFGYQPVLLSGMLNRLKQVLIDDGYLKKWGWQSDGG